MKDNNELPDVQCTEPHIKRAIQQVGVENVEVPFSLESRNGNFYQTIANVSMRTNLDKDIKGISMSRLILTLKPYLSLPLKQVLIKEILDKITENVGGTNSFIKFEFRLSYPRQSPISKHEFPIYYKCKFEGQMRGDEFKFFQGVKIQYASYCPCSSELSKHLEDNGSKGYPHAQRSFTDILVETGTDKYIWLEDIIESVEEFLHTKPFPIIKRVDEQEIARIAAENTMFVEDAIRVISQSLDNMDGVIDWLVKCSHEESIHTSEAIAISYKGVDNGLNSKYYI